MERISSVRVPCGEVTIPCTSHLCVNTLQGLNDGERKRALYYMKGYRVWLAGTDKWMFPPAFSHFKTGEKVD